jgi:outer membrane protein OmpA-like peptidoglycan-associated protein
MKKSILSILSVVLGSVLLLACTSHQSGYHHTTVSDNQFSGNMSAQADVLRSQLAESGVAVQQTANGLKLVMPADVTFATGSYVINPKFYHVLDTVVLALKYDSYKIRVEGNTDNVGSAASNQVLSENRANAVEMYLWNHGIAPTRLSSVGYGENKPVASNKTAAGRALNRRVEIHVYE